MRLRYCCKGSDCAKVTRQRTRCPHMCHSNRYLRQHMGSWYLSYCRVPKAQASLCTYADSSEPSLLALMARILRARDFGNVVTLSSDEGYRRPCAKFLISYFYITKSILISQNALDFVLSQIRFCDI